MAKGSLVVLLEDREPPKAVPQASKDHENDAQDSYSPDRFVGLRSIANPYQHLAVPGKPPRNVRALYDDLYIDIPIVQSLFDDSQWSEVLSRTTTTRVEPRQRLGPL